ncbi:hypothetical protein [Actinomadura physcomitrii]|nr:hypothetical protein [Actinomadura physcomitrii]
MVEALGGGVRGVLEEDAQGGDAEGLAELAPVIRTVKRAGPALRP